MKKSKLKIYLGIFLFILFLFPFQIQNHLEKSEVEARSRDKKILIVAGHDDQSPGAVHKDLREVDLNRKLAEYLYEELKDEKGIYVSLVSDSEGYTGSFKRFFEKKREKIEKFIKKSKEEFTEKIEEGEYKPEGSDHHNAAGPEVAYKLYAINYWAEDNNFDLVLHIHFNDYPKRHLDNVPKYQGFSIYIPEKQMPNHQKSERAAEKIFKQLKKVSSVSNMPLEKEGIIETQQLIAIGANETLGKVPSVLVEYGYIYENQFANPFLKHFSLQRLAKRTAIAIEDYFN